jgi:hypothetical protein
MSGRMANRTQRTVVTTVTNGVTTATQAAQVGMRHYINGYSISVSGATPAVGTVEIRSAAVVKDRIELPAVQLLPTIISLSNPIECGINEAATIELLAGMGATQKCTVSIRTYTIAE